MFIIWLRSPLAWGSSPMDVHTSKFSAVRPCSYLSSWFCVETQTGHVPFWFSPFVCTVLEMKLGQSLHLDVEVLLKSYLGAAPCPKNRFVSLGPEAGTFMPITWGTPQGEDFTTSLGKMPKATPAGARESSNSGAPLWKRCQSSEHICPLETETVLRTKKLKMLMCPQCWDQARLWYNPCQRTRSCAADEGKIPLLWSNKNCLTGFIIIFSANQWIW